MKRIIFIVGAAAMLLAMNGCHTAKKAQATAGVPATPADNSAAAAAVAADDASIDMALVGKRWRAFELFGKPVGPVNNKVANISFTGDNRFSGNAGCNNLSGSFQTTGNFRIRFSQVAVTQMMCINMDVETQFLQVINTADSYVVRDDTLTLIRARMAPLARLVAEPL